MIVYPVLFVSDRPSNSAALSRKRFWFSNILSLAMFLLPWSLSALEFFPDSVSADELARNEEEATFVITGKDFDRTSVGDLPGAADRIRQKMLATVESEILQIDRRCSLSPEQKRKLALAGRGDGVHVFERLSDLRRKWSDSPMTLLDYHQVWASLEDLRWAMDDGVFSETSLFGKTLRNLLTAEQLVEYRKLERARGMKILEYLCSRVEDITASKLSGDCRRKLLELLADKAKSSKSAGPYAVDATWLEAARFQDELRPLMRDKQWRTFQEAIRNAQWKKQFHGKSELWPYDDATKDESAELPMKSVEKQEDKS